MLPPNMSREDRDKMAERIKFSLVASEDAYQAWYGSVKMTLELFEKCINAFMKFDGVYLLREAVEKYPEFLENCRIIIQGWKQRIQGRLMMERYLKKGTIFISTEDEEAYPVNGIILSREVE